MFTGQDLENLCNSGKDIFVTNTSKPLGKIVLVVTEPGSTDGKSVVIPSTTKPVRLTDHVSHAAIKSCSSLRKCIAGGFLVVHGPEEVKEEDIRKVDVGRKPMTNTTESMTDMATKLDPEPKADEKGPSGHEMAGLHNPAPGVSERLVQLVLLLTADKKAGEKKEINDKDAAVELADFSSTLRAEDLRWSLTMIQESVHPETYRVVRKALKRLRKEGMAS